MNITLAREVIRSGLSMDVISRHQVVEAGHIIDDQRLEGIIAQLNAHLEEKKGIGYNLANYPLDRLAALLGETGIVSPARRLELVRIDLTKLVPETPEMKDALLAKAFCGLDR